MYKKLIQKGGGTESTGVWMIWKNGGHKEDVREQEKIELLKENEERGRMALDDVETLV